MNVNKMETLNKELTIIEKARQAIQSFPEKLTKNQEELKELVNDWDNMAEHNRKAEEHNANLYKELEEHKPILKDAESMSWDFKKTAEKILNPKIKEAWEKDRKHEHFNHFFNFYELQAELLSIEKVCEQLSRKTATIKELFTRKWQKTIYYSNDILKVEKQIETRLNRENKK